MNYIWVYLNEEVSSFIYMYGCMCISFPILAYQLYMYVGLFQ